MTHSRVYALSFCLLASISLCIPQLGWGSDDKDQFDLGDGHKSSSSHSQQSQPSSEDEEEEKENEDSPSSAHSQEESENEEDEEDDDRSDATYLYQFQKILINSGPRSCSDGVDFPWAGYKPSPLGGIALAVRSD